MSKNYINLRAQCDDLIHVNTENTMFYLKTNSKTKLEKALYKLTWGIFLLFVYE